MFNEAHCKRLTVFGVVTYTATVTVAQQGGASVSGSASLGYTFKDPYSDAQCADVSAGLTQSGLLSTPTTYKEKLYVKEGATTIGSNEMQKTF